MKRLTTFLMALLLTWIGASAQSSWTAPTLPTSTLTNEGKYYLYNTEAEMFMGNVSILWGTEAGFSDSGFLATLTYDSSNSAYTIYNNGGNSGYVFRDGNYLYVNGSTNSDATNYARRFFTFTALGDGTYTIQTAWTEDDYSGYLGYDAESTTAKENEIITTLASTATGIYWKLIAEDAEELYDALVILYNTLVHAESYGMTADSNEAYKSAGEVYLSSTATADEVMAAVVALEVAMEGYASEDDPDDVTYAYITNPSFDTGSISGWTSSDFWYQSTPHSNENGDITISGYAENWVASTSKLDDSKIYQTLADLPVGTYRLEADAIAVKQTSDSPEVMGVYLYASSLTTSMTSVSTTDGLPAHYTVDFEVAEEGSVEIGFKVISTNANWVAVDNFRLYYLSSAVTELTDTESDYKEGDEATIYGHSYNVKSNNMVENHSFELGLEGWTDLSSSHNTITAEKFDLCTDDPQDGNVYLVGTTNEGTSETASGSLCTAWSIESGKTYYFSYYVKSLGTATDGGYLRTDVVNELGGESDGVVFSTPTVTTEWQKIEYLFTNTDYKLLQIEFRWLNSQWGFDNFQLYQVEPAEDVLDDSEYTTGDEVTVDGKAYTVVGDNMFVNGGFNADMYGWTAAGYYVAADPENFDVEEEGGFNEGAYLVASSAGTGSVKTPSQAIAVEEGKTYLFIGYTSGKTPQEDDSASNLQYSALFKMSDAVTEASSDKIIVQMLWGAESQQESDTWTQTMAVFTAETDYVGMRMGWSGGSYDGFQLYEVEAVEETIDWEMTTANWGTLILPFDAEIPTGLTAYAGDALDLSSDGTTITVSDPSDAIEANTPYLVSGTAGSYSFTGAPTNTEDSYTVGMLTGTLVNMTQDDFTADGTEYVLQNHTEVEDGEEEAEGLAFYPITSASEGVELDAYHCYLTISSDVSPTALHLPGMSTGIVAVEGAETLANDAIYDLSGRRVSKAVKGVYIQNGKKVLVK